MRSFSVLLVALVALAVVSSVQAQAPIPYRADGYQIGGPSTAPIQLDAFFDLLCPDCAAAWPNVLQVLQYYGQNISVNVHTFPLPYHTNGFMAAQAAHVILDRTPDETSRMNFINFMFQNQAKFWNGATADMTWNAVLAQLQSYVVENNFIDAADFAAGMADDNINNEARVSWKYACSRGVLGTPTFLVNGVFVAADPSWTLSDWRQLLDPLLQPQPSVRHVAPAKPSKPHGHRKAAPKCAPRKYSTRRFVSTVSDCPAGEPTCAYLPGKVECCLPGEECIPNVGCRC